MIKINKILMGIVFFCLVISCSNDDNLPIDNLSLTELTSDCRDTNCANYSSQSAAQAAFDLDPECRKDLDRDNDGIACEEPGNIIKTCTSTSNCGCSNKTKTRCQQDPCCRWVVGEGCKCS